MLLLKSIQKEPLVSSGQKAIIRVASDNRFGYNRFVVDLCLIEINNVIHNRRNRCYSNNNYFYLSLPITSKMTKPRNVGYACINMQLSYPKEYGNKKLDPITTNRTMIRKTYDELGIKYASKLSLENVKDLYKIIMWNKINNINFFRVSSNMFPWASEYKWEDLPDYEQICYWLNKSGELAKQHSQRITAHPGPFNKLTSEDERIIKNTISDLEIHAWIFDKMGLDQTTWSKINIHVGAAYGDKQKASSSFCKNFERLSHSVRSRLTVENDDKESLYSVSELYELIYKKINIPIVFDYHHHKLCNGGQTEQEALSMACSTWADIVPATHYSESRMFEQNNIKIKPQAHSDFVYSDINTYGLVVDTMIESKMKELSVQKWLQTVS